MALMKPSSSHRNKRSLQTHGQTGQEQRSLMSEGCRITQVGREPQEVSSATSCPKYKRLGQTKRCRTSPRCALKSHSALSFIPDNSAGNVDGGITLTRQVVTTQGQEWGRDLGVQVFEKRGETEESCRNRSWQGAQAPPCIPCTSSASYTSCHSCHQGV